MGERGRGPKLSDKVCKRTMSTMSKCKKSERRTIFQNIFYMERKKRITQFEGQEERRVKYEENSLEEEHHKAERRTGTAR